MQTNTINFDELLSSSKSFPKTIKRGALVKGTVTSVSPEAVHVDVGYRADGVIMGSDMYSDGDRTLPKVGDEITTFVINDGAALGYPKLSIKQAGNSKHWANLEKALRNGTTVDATVTDVNTGGVMVSLVGQIRGFVPISHLDPAKLGSVFEDNSNNDASKQQEKIVSQLQNFVGDKLKVKPIEVDKKKNRVLLSERRAIAEAALADGLEISASENLSGGAPAAYYNNTGTSNNAMKAQLIARVKVGDVMESTVVSVAPFGLFVDVQGIDGLIHISQVSWSRVDDLNKLYKTGDKFNVKVISVDQDNYKVGFSIKMLENDPWTNIAEKLQVGQIIKAKINKIVEYGAFVFIEDGIAGLVHNSECAENSQVRASDVFKEGQLVELKVLEIDPAQRRVSLSRRAVEAMQKSAAAAE